MLRVFCESVNIPPPNLRERSTLANNFRGLIFRARSVRRCSFVALQICKWNYFGFFFFLNDWTLTFLVLQKKEIRRIITMMNEKNLLR